MNETPPTPKPTSDERAPAPDDYGKYAPGPSLTRKIELARRTSFSKGLYLLSSLVRKTALWQIGKAPVDYEFRGLKARFRPNGNTAEKRALLNPARFDSFELDFLTRTLPVGGTFLDIGANAGLYSLVASKALGPAGTALAFEPNPIVLERLTFNVACNAANRAVAPIQIIPKAVTGGRGNITFVQPANNLGEGQVVMDGSPDGELISVEGTDLKSCLAEFGITKVDALKIDIEGHELSALEPFLAKAPQSLHPHYMIVERGSDDHWAALETLFAAHGYAHLHHCPMNEIWQKQ